MSADGETPMSLDAILVRLENAVLTGQHDEMRALCECLSVIAKNQQISGDRNRLKGRLSALGRMLSSRIDLHRSLKERLKPPSFYNVHGETTDTDGEALSLRVSV